MFGLGIPEIAIIGAIIMLLFGPSLVRKFFTGAKDTVIEVKKIQHELKKELKDEI